ncbi:MAG: YicC family protein [Planctomycetota bacterium]|jgi:uncharacterized protein (TIGR00255 family)|nr:YicC family protein [Planctomycetota bacterium]MDA1202547.1 YicC family protein [Planctomycetota bacterium]
MPNSMTGCGEGIATAGESTCRVELRTVNNRSFKFSLRTREGFVGLEPRVETLVRQRVRRGTVQMTLDLTGAAATVMRRIDAAQLAAYLDQLEDFAASHDLALPRSIDGLLGLPGITADAPPEEAALERAWPLVAEAVERALAALDTMRRAEGETLAADMRSICREIARLVAGIRERVPQAVEQQRVRLLERVSSILAERGVSLAEADVAREIALVADRTDIAEEIVRLESHLAQFERLLGEESPGRPLDFLSQELAREANTIASKSADVGIAHAVVELKTRIERLREQVQNLE